MATQQQDNWSSEASNTPPRPSGYWQSIQLLTNRTGLPKRGLIRAQAGHQGGAVVGSAAGRRDPRCGLRRCVLTFQHSQPKPKLTFPDGVLNVDFARILAQGTGRVHGIDSSAAMIAAAQASASSANLAHKATFEGTPHLTQPYLATCPNLCISPSPRRNPPPIHTLPPNRHIHQSLLQRRPPLDPPPPHHPRSRLPRRARRPRPRRHLHLRNGRTRQRLRDPGGTAGSGRTARRAGARAGGGSVVFS